VSVLAVAVVPGAIADTESDPIRNGHLSIQEVTIAPGTVSGGTATLQVDTRLAHTQGRSENVTLLVRAVHLESGLVETMNERTVEPISGEREVSVQQNLSVERSGGYRIETIVYQDNERIAHGSKEVHGVGTLTPEYARTNVRFHWQADSDFPPVEYTVQNAADNRTTLNVSTFLTNEADEASEELRVVFTLRQADSNIVADRASVGVGAIAPGRTAAPSVELSVPDGYNYYLDAVLWKDGVIVGTARSVANLNPTETVETNKTVHEVGIEVGDFDDDSTSNDGRNRETTTEEGAASGGIPGFGVGVTALALVGALLLARRNS
jgi:PGF-CTERM protein